MTSTASIKAKWAHIEYQGRQRAKISDEKWLASGNEPTDAFTHEGMSIHNPWLSTCGRFKVNPYTTYGRPFIIWLLQYIIPDKE